jgi:hypothetical protein
MSGLGIMDSVLLIAGTNKSFPLPVKLLQLSASKASQDVKVNWLTASETNSSYFEIQRSSGNGAWKTVGTTKAAGNSMSRLSYAFTDRAAFANNTGTLYYRLKAVDRNGSFEYSGTVAVGQEKNMAARSESVYPNPFNDGLFINMEALENSTVTVELFDITGKKVAGKTYENIMGSAEINFPLNDITIDNGVYFLSIEHNGTRSVQKVIKH